MEDIRLRNMASVFLTCGDEVLLLYRQGGRVVNNVYVPSAGGHFEKDELNDPAACALRELNEELGLTASDIRGFALRYIAFRQVGSEIRQNYYYFAEAERSLLEKLVSNEGTLRIIHASDISSVEMAVSAAFALKHYFETGRSTTCVYVSASNGTRADFTPLG